MLRVTEMQYRQHRNEYDGYCTACDDIGRWGMTEPDAEKYECEECGKNTCMGIDNALIMGFVDIIEGEE